MVILFSQYDFHTHLHYNRDNIYVNYAGKLIENAFIYAKSENEYQSDLACRLVV